MRFLGDSLKRLREFPEDVRQDAADPLEKVQKQAQATSPRDVELARTRWLALSNER
jgi:phage-related protein